MARKFDNSQEAADKLFAEYLKNIRELFDWEGLKQECLDNLEEDYENPNQLIGACYLGSIMDLFPSGKYYTFWTSNQTEGDTFQDGIFGEALDTVANEYGLYISSGENDPTDVLAYLVVDKDEENETEHDS